MTKKTEDKDFVSAWRGAVVSMTCEAIADRVVTYRAKARGVFIVRGMKFVPPPPDGWRYDGGHLVTADELPAALWSREDTMRLWVRSGRKMPEPMVLDAAIKGYKLLDGGELFVGIRWPEGAALEPEELPLAMLEGLVPNLDYVPPWKRDQEGEGR